MGKRLGAALDELRTAFFEAYAALAEEGAKTGNEQQRRESSCDPSTRSWSGARWPHFRPRISDCSKFTACGRRLARGDVPKRAWLPGVRQRRSRPL